MTSLCLHENATGPLSIAMSNNVKACDELMRWFKFSVKRSSDFASTCKSMDYAEVTMKELCRTRWIERIFGINIFTSYIACIVQTLWDIVHNKSDWEYSSKDKGLAMSFLKGIQTYPFLLSLIVFRELIGLYESMTRELQGIRVDIPRARRAARSILLQITEYRTIKLDWFCTSIFKHTDAICLAARSQSEIDGNIFFIRPVPPRCAATSVFRENHRPENYAEMPIKDRCEWFYRVSLIIPILDSMQQELKTRFENDDAIEAWDIAVACSPYDQIRVMLDLLADNQTVQTTIQRTRFEQELLPYTVTTRGGSTGTSATQINVPERLLKKWKLALVKGVHRFRKTLIDLNDGNITATVQDPTGVMLENQIDDYISFWLKQTPGTVFDKRDMAENISFMDARGLLCPVVVSLTMIILSCAATSVTPERGFSWEHSISTKFRTRSKIGRLSNLVMLYSNPTLPINLCATYKKLHSEQWSQMDENHGDKSQVQPPKKLNLKKCFDPPLLPEMPVVAVPVVGESQNVELMVDEEKQDTTDEIDFDGDEDEGMDDIKDTSNAVKEPIPVFECDEELAQGEFIVEKILDRKVKGRGHQYLVKWLNYNEDCDNTWEAGCGLPKQFLDEYNKKFPLT